MAKDDLYVNPVTGLAPVKFLGIKVGDDYQGESGSGLRVNEVRGVDPALAAMWIEKKYAEQSAELIKEARAAAADHAKALASMAPAAQAVKA